MQNFVTQPSKIATREGSVRLRPGTCLYLDSQILQIIPSESASPLMLTLQNLDTGVKSEVSITSILKPANPEAVVLAARSRAELEAKITFNQPVSKLVSAAALPNRLLKKADKILSIYHAIERSISLAKNQASLNLKLEEFSLKQTIEKACDAQKIASSTYYKYRAMCIKYENNRDSIAQALATKYPNRLSKAQYHFLDTLIMRFALRGERERTIGSITFLSLYRLAQDILISRMDGLWLDPAECGLNIPQDLVDQIFDPTIPVETILANPEKKRLLTTIKLPGHSTFFNYVRWYLANPRVGEELLKKKHGEEAWRNNYGTFDIFAYKATFPLQHVFCDHWLLDAFIVDEETRSKITRLWLTVLIDAFSRSILGFALNYEDPCIESVSSALLHAIWPKDSHTKYNINKEYVCYGIPQNLYLDNAWAHHSHSLENISRGISQGGMFNSITLVHRPPYKGNYGALIERYFRTLSGKTKELLPGAIMSSHPKDVQNAAKKACLLYEDMNCFVHKLTLEYMHTVHSELDGLTPHQKWVQSLDIIPDAIPPLDQKMEALFWRTYPDTRQKTRQGIALFGMHYNSPDIKKLPMVNKQGQSIQYGIRYKPDDISRIAVFDEGSWVGDGYASELKQADDSYRSISQWERQMALELTDKTTRTAGEWLKLVNDIDELTAQRVQEKKNLQKQKGKSTQKPAGKPLSSEAVQELSEAVKTAQNNGTDTSRTKALAGFYKR